MLFSCQPCFQNIIKVSNNFWHHPLNNAKMTTEISDSHRFWLHRTRIMRRIVLGPLNNSRQSLFQNPASLSCYITPKWGMSREMVSPQVCPRSTITRWQWRHQASVILLTLERHFHTLWKMPGIKIICESTCHEVQDRVLSLRTCRFLVDSKNYYISRKSKLQKAAKTIFVNKVKCMQQLRRFVSFFVTLYHLLFFIVLFLKYRSCVFTVFFFKTRI